MRQSLVPLLNSPQTSLSLRQNDHSRATPWYANARQNGEYVYPANDPFYATDACVTLLNQEPNGWFGGLGRRRAEWKQGNSSLTLENKISKYCVDVQRTHTLRLSWHASHCGMHQSSRDNHVVSGRGAVVNGRPALELFIGTRSVCASNHGRLF